MGNGVCPVNLIKRVKSFIRKLIIFSIIYVDDMPVRACTQIIYDASLSLSVNNKLKLMTT